jgi:hypothetical protein
LASSAAGRVFYQTALTATQNDNGYVTMFFLLTPALSALISFPLSRWIADLRFIADPLFFIGIALVTASLFLFSLLAWRGAQVRRSPGRGGAGADIGWDGARRGAVHPDCVETTPAIAR